MAKNEEPIFTRTPVLGQAEISTANTNLDGTGTIVAVVNGGTDGVRVDHIEVKAEGTTTAGMVRLFLSFDGGTTWHLWREIDVTALTPGATQQSFRDEIIMDISLSDTPLLLENTNMVLGAAPHNAETFNVFARGGSFAA